MQEKSIEEIEVIANNLQANSQSWHFHILTPKCQLNTEKRFAFILEDSSNNNSYVCYSDKPYMEVGKKLVKLLHGDKIASGEQKAEQSNVKEKLEITQIIRRANELKRSGKQWHHHMLFPDCIFNKHHGNWALVFEDPETGEIIESVSSSEPKEDLCKIETLYYQQSNLQ